MAVDLWIAIAIMILVAIAAGLFAGGYAYSLRGQRTILCLAMAVLAMVLFMVYGSGQLFWARLVPLSAAIIYTNFAAVFAALAAGWAWRLPHTPAWRRATMASLLALAALASVLWPLLSIALRPPPEGDDRWSRGVAMQSARATCSPAAAATLLRAEGILVSESQMIPLCLTDASGTPTLGLYRGIKLMAQWYGRRVSVLDESLDELLEQADWPVLLAVKLPYSKADSRYAARRGWIPGLGHSVVVLDQYSDGRLLVGDPATGLEVWSKEDLNVLWHGNGIRLR